MRVLSIDPSGTGTSGIFFINDTNQEFHQFQGKEWKGHLNFIREKITELKPSIIIYEHTNFINLKGADMTSLFKLFGAMETLTCLFDFIQQITNIPVHQVKGLKDKILKGIKTIPSLTYKKGRGNGWQWGSEKISIHQLDALLVYLIWSKKY